jgi:acyl carrier protein
MAQQLDLLDGLIDLIEKVSPVPVEREAITRETDFINDLLLDSLAFVSLIALAEEFYGCSIAGVDGSESLDTVGDALDVLARALRPAAA